MSPPVREGRLVGGSPGEGVAVVGAVGGVDVHVEDLLFGDDRGIEPGGGGELVPEVVELVGVVGDVLRGGRVWRSAISASICLVNWVLMEMSTVVRSMRGQGARRTMWAASGSNQKLNSWRGWVANSGSSVWGLRLPPMMTMPWVSSAKCGIDGDGERDVGERAGGVDGDLLGMGVDLADEEVGGVFVERLGGGRAFFERGDYEGAVVRLHAGVLGEVAPGAVPGEAADERGFEHGLGLVRSEREDCAGDYGDVGAMDEFEHAEGVLRLLRAPTRCR